MSCAVKFKIYILFSLLVVMIVGCEVPGPQDGQALEPGYVAPPASTVLTDIAYGPEEWQVLDIYYPETQTAGVILYIHGGGWWRGDKTDIPPIALRQVSRGWVVISMNYALTTWPSEDLVPTNPFPAALHDTKRAIRFIKAAAVFPLGLDATYIVPWGYSAGGTLAGLAVVSEGYLEPPELPPYLEAFDSSVAAGINFSGPLDFKVQISHDDPWGNYLVTQWLGCSVLHDTSTCNPEIVAAASAHTYYDACDPAIYLGFGGQDTLIPYSTSVALMAKYYKAGLADYAWFDLAEESGHNVDYGVNLTVLEAGLNLVNNGKATPRGCGVGY